MSLLPPYLILLVKYITPLFLVFYNYYICPLILFKVVQYERYERRSEKEDSFMTKHILFMVLNSLIIPFCVCAYLSGLIIKTSVPNQISIPKLAKNIFNTTADANM